MKPKELSARETKVLKLLVGGNTSKDIAALLDISHRTVEVHRRNIMEKLGINHLPGLTKYALKNNLVRLGSLRAWQK